VHGIQDQQLKKEVGYPFVKIANLLKSLEAAPALVPVLVQPVVGLPHLEQICSFGSFFLEFRNRSTW
jgi:hypothetical protein